VSNDESVQPKGAIGLPFEGEERVLRRQKWQCYNCNVHFSPPNSVGYIFKQIKPKTKGHGWHKVQQFNDFGNVAAYCEKCFQKERASVVKPIRFKKTKVEQYNLWMEGEPRYARKERGSPNFSKMVQDAVEFFTDQDYFKEEKNHLHIQLEEYRNQAESFLEILALYNTRKDDISFAKQVVDFFGYYTPPVRSLETNEQIDNHTSDRDLRNFLKSVRDEEMKLILERKEAGHRHYEANSDEYRE